MKKFLVIILAVSLVLLAGCSVGGDSDVSRMVDPMAYGSVIDGPAPSASLDPDDSAKKQELYDTASSETVFTADMRGTLRNGYFVGEEFSFFVPSQWRESFEVRSAETRSGAFYMRTFDFCYTDPAGETAPVLLRIDIVYAEFADAYGNIGRKEMGRSADGVHVYLNTPISTDLPEGFGAVTGYIEVYRLLQNEETLDFKVLV